MTLHIFETAVTRAMLPGLIRALERHTQNGWRWNEYAGSIPETWVEVRSVHKVDRFHLFLTIRDGGKIETSPNFPSKEGAKDVAEIAQLWDAARNRIAGMMFMHYKQALKREREELEKRIAEGAKE